MSAEKNFFLKLVDISFSEFVTLRILGAIYVVVIIFDVIASVYVAIYTFQFFNFFSAVTGLIFLFTFALIARMVLELAAASIRTAINTTRIVDALRSQVDKV